MRHQSENRAGLRLLRLAAVWSILAWGILGGRVHAHGGILPDKKKVDIAFRVVDAKTGKPIPNAEVRISPVDKSFSGTQTDGHRDDWSGRVGRLEPGPADRETTQIGCLDV